MSDLDDVFDSLTVKIADLEQRLKSLEQMEVDVAQQITLSAFGEQLVANLTPRSIITFSYNINTELASTATTGSGTAGVDSRMLKLSTGAAITSTAELSSRSIVDYQPGTGAVARFTAIFTTGVVGSTQWIGIGSDEDGFFFGYNGVDMSVNKRRGSVDGIVAQSNWSIDKANGTGTLPVMDWTKGNVFQIRYQWLGFGMITFYIENPSTGMLTAVHEIEYANANTLPSVDNPSFPLHAYVENTTNNTDIILRTASMGGYLEGRHIDTGPLHSVDNEKLNINTTETNILTIRSKSTYQTFTNRIHINILEIAADSDGTKAVTIRLVRNTALGGVPAYADISTNTSVIEYDTAGTTVTGGVVIKTIRLSRLESKDIDLATLGIELYAGETLTVSAQTDSGNSDIGSALTWRESI